ncbi:MAG: LuxR C-terminal-related transcriptional regulator [Thermomicrobiales bacterium]
MSEIDLASFNPVEGSITVFLSVAGRHRDALARGRAFLETYAHVPVTDSTVAKAFGDAHNGIALCLAMLGHTEEARTHFDRAFEIYDQPNMKSATVEMMLRTLIIPYFATDEHEFELQLRSFERLMDSVESLFTFDPQILALSRQHRWLLLRGCWKEAERSAMSHNGFLGVNSYSNDATATLAELCRLRGEYQQAWLHIMSLLPDGPDQEPGTIRYTTGIYAIQTAANLALDENEFVHARDWIKAHRYWLEWSEAALGWAEHDLLNARYRLLTGDPERAQAHAREALASASHPSQPLVLLAIHRLLGMIARDAGEFDEATDHLRKAGDIAANARARYEQVLVEIEQIALSIATGETNGISEKIEVARGLLSEIGAEPALARLSELDGQLLSMPESPAGFAALTEREMDVLRLVAAGLPNADVAERLSISPRTVTTHLSSIYRKLDTSSRTTITRIAIEHGLSA